MSDERTPTDYDIRVHYVEYAKEVFRSWNPGQPVRTSEELVAPFNQWLTEHDAKIRTECAEVARDLGTAMRDGIGWDDEWSTREVRDALNIAADKIDGTREWD